MPLSKPPQPNCRGSEHGAGQNNRAAHIPGGVGRRGGGVAFGAYLYKRDVKNPLEADLQPGEATFNPFVKVDAQG